ncbi:hypothetical protein AKJ48_02515 [candidate division MSBL1 archaeon SCGC-AAA261O19]|uniref:Ferrous iron transporter n=2 Tax=candidate division MSBL1 TaxID=215777 RepID=A0A133UY92_9EURY|nr:hypothetical protein AKJ42_03625 [candidate division MSBL1 archaeon SCGC-AAA261C02]KXB04468.1 hypothetical protein AKJ48_02515 [candidate division MSBL1 archaeon SCGC-AAA261O19]
MVVYPYVVSLREGLEAALIIAILIGYLVRIKRPDLSKYVWWGVGSAIALSFGLGAGIWAVYGELGGVGEKLFEAGAAGTAVIVLTYMIFWMARNAKKIKGELEKKIDVSISRKWLLGITLLAFTAVFREGLETVLFLTASAFSNPAGTAIGATAGFATVIAIGFFLLRGTERLPIRKFFTITSILLLIFAAGILSYGVHEGIEAVEEAGHEVHWLEAKAYDFTPSTDSIFHPKEGAIGAVIQGLIGKIYLSPEWLTLIAYLLYWLIVGTYMLKVYAPTKFNGFIEKLFRRK